MLGFFFLSHTFWYHPKISRKLLLEKLTDNRRGCLCRTRRFWCHMNSFCFNFFAGLRLNDISDAEHKLTFNAVELIFLCQFSLERCFANLKFTHRQKQALVEQFFVIERGKSVSNKSNPRVKIALLSFFQLVKWCNLQF